MIPQRVVIDRHSSLESSSTHRFVVDHSLEREPSGAEGGAGRAVERNIAIRRVPRIRPTSATSGPEPTKLDRPWPSFGQGSRVFVQIWTAFGNFLPLSKNGHVYRSWPDVGQVYRPNMCPKRLLWSTIFHNPCSASLGGKRCGACAERAQSPVSVSRRGSIGIRRCLVDNSSSTKSSSTRL